MTAAVSNAEQPQQQSRTRARGLAIAFAGAVLGGACGYAASIAALAPIACLAIPFLAVIGWRSGAWPAFAAVLAFHLVVTRDLQVAAHAFFPTASSAYWTNLVILLACLSFSAAWVWLPRCAARLRLAPGAGLGVALAITLAPPLGVFAVAHPVFAYGYLWPGGGWIALVVLSLAACWVAGRLASARLIAQLSLVAAVLAASAMNSAELSPARGTDKLRSVNTSWPHGPLSASNRVDRITRVGRVTRELDKLGVTWIVFPESAIYPTPGLEYLLSLEVDQRRAATVWLGMAQGEPGSVSMPMLGILEAQGGIRLLPARQPVPLAPGSWTAAAWTQPAQIPSPVGPAYVSICYEDLIPGLFLLSVAAEGRPSIVVSMANSAFLKPDAVASQAWRIESLSRLFGLPLLRAVNLPPSPQAAAR